VLFEDETILRELPPLRAGWAKGGEQVVVPITGRNRRRTLFATLNPKTGQVVQQGWPDSRAASFQAFLRYLRGTLPLVDLVAPRSPLGQSEPGDAGGGRESQLREHRGVDQAGAPLA
jgi:hypothetical protein